MLGQMSKFYANGFYVCQFKDNASISDALLPMTGGRGEGKAHRSSSHLSHPIEQCVQIAGKLYFLYAYRRISLLNKGYFILV